MMATAVEAILGAVHLDGGDAALHHVLTQLRIVNPHTLLVQFQLPCLLAWMMQIRYDLLTLTLIGLIRNGREVAILRGCGARDSFDLSDRGVFDYKARSCYILAHRYSRALLCYSKRPGERPANVSRSLLCPAK